MWNTLWDAYIHGYPATGKMCWDKGFSMPISIKHTAKKKNKGKRMTYIKYGYTWNLSTQGSKRFSSSSQWYPWQKLRSPNEANRVQCIVWIMSLLCLEFWVLSVLSWWLKLNLKSFKVLKTTKQTFWLLYPGSNIVRCWKIHIIC